MVFALTQSFWLLKRTFLLTFFRELLQRRLVHQTFVEGKETRWSVVVSEILVILLFAMVNYMDWWAGVRELVAHNRTNTPSWPIFINWKIGFLKLLVFKLSVDWLCIFPSLKSNNNYVYCVHFINRDFSLFWFSLVSV